MSTTLTDISNKNFARISTLHGVSAPLGSIFFVCCQSCVKTTFGLIWHKMVLRHSLVFFVVPPKWCWDTLQSGLEHLYSSHWVFCRRVLSLWLDVVWFNFLDFCQSDLEILVKILTFLPNAETTFFSIRTDPLVQLFRCSVKEVLKTPFKVVSGTFFWFELLGCLAKWG